MDAHKSILITLSLYVYGVDLPHPRNIHTPSTVKNSKWVPQTIVDSIWFLWEFDSIESKKAFLASPPSVFSKAKIMEKGQGFFDQWANGNSVAKESI